MKVGIMGSGMLVQYAMISAIKKAGAEEIYIASRKESYEKNSELASKYELNGAFEDYEALVKSDVDIVYICLPNYLHYKYAKLALEAGKHVVLEKPFASNVKETKELYDLAAKNNLYLFDAMSLYGLPNFKEIKNYIDKIGAIRVVNLNYSQYSSKYTAFRNGETPKVFDPKFSGGALTDINIYNVAFVLKMFGKPQKIKYFPTMQRGIDTSGTLILTYAGFVVSCVGAKDSMAKAVCTIQGEDGTISISPMVNGMRGFSVEVGKETSTINVPQDENHFVYEFKEFFDCIIKSDRAKYEEFRSDSMLLMEILEEARKDAGIVYDADR